MNTTLFDVRTLNVIELSQVNEGDLMLLSDPPKPQLAMRVKDSRDTGASPAIIFGDQPKYMRFEPAVQVPCLVLGTAAFRVPSSGGLESFTKNEAGLKEPILVFEGSNVHLQVRGLSDFVRVNLKTGRVSEMVTNKWFATQWAVGIESRAGDFTSLFEWRPKGN